MSFKIRWLVQDRILFGNIAADFNPEQLAILDATMLQLLDATPEGCIVHTINDMRHNLQTKLSLNEQRNLTFPKHPKFGWTVMYGLQMNPLTKMSMSIMTQIFRVNFREVAKFNDALAFLQFIDKTLPDLSSYRSDADYPSLDSSEEFSRTE